MNVIDWDDAFSNAAYIDGAEEYPARWAALAAEFRATAQARLDLPYANSARTRLDLFQPKTDSAQGLVVFVHGGYWLKFDKSVWSHLAAGAVARGWAVAIPSYTLAPAARISQMTTEIGQAITASATLVAGPILLAGHSAGGHLVTRMICTDSPLPPAIRARLGHVLSISGLHDLRPLLATQMNRSLGLSDAEAVAESPALTTPIAASRVSAWVGAFERPEFLRQAGLLREAWGAKGAQVSMTVLPDSHHFDIVEGLSTPESALCEALLEC